MSLGVVAVLVWAALSLPSELLPNAGSRIVAATLLVVGPLALPEVWLNTTNSQVYLGVLALLYCSSTYTRWGARRSWRSRCCSASPVSPACTRSRCAAVRVPRVPGAHTPARDPRGGRLGLRARAAGRRAALARVGRPRAGRGSFPGFGAIVRDVSTWHFGTLLLGNPIATHLHANAHSFFRIVGFGFVATIVAAVLAFVLASSALPRSRGSSPPRS